MERHGRRDIWKEMIADKDSVCKIKRRKEVEKVSREPSLST